MNETAREILLLEGEMQVKEYMISIAKERDLRISYVLQLALLDQYHAMLRDITIL